MAGLGTFIGTPHYSCACSGREVFVTRRIPAAGAIVGSTTVSAVLALCVLGGVAGGVAAQASSVAGQTMPGQTVAGQTSPLATSPMTIAMTSSIESPLAVSNAADTTVAPDVQPVFGLLGGAAAAQIPAAAQVLSAAPVVAAPATLSVAAPATLSVAAPAKLSIAVPAPIAVTSIARTPIAPTLIALPAIAGTPRQMAYAVAVRAGLSAQQWSCLSQLWQQESKFETTVRNDRSGAYGIPQALPASRMASAGADWRTNPVTQVKWGLSYISARYGTACAAWSHWERDRWY